jgi:hypothetical protein
VKTGALRRDSYNFIVSDNPFRALYGNGYAEHFELFPELLRYMDDGILILVFLPRRNDFGAEHARRREEFYGKADPSIDEAAAVYREHLERAGLRSREHLYTFRNPLLGYLTFVCRRG